MQTSFRRYFAFEAVPGTNGASKKGSEWLHQDKEAPSSIAPNPKRQPSERS